MQDTPQPASDTHVRPIRLTIVEDKTRTRERIVHLIQQQLSSAQITQFAQFSTAQTFAKHEKQDYWLVDLGLPDGSGIDLIRLIRRQDAHTLILVISVFGDVDNIVASIQAGANGYLLKDAVEQDLVQAVRALGVGGTPLSPMIASRLLEHMMPTSLMPEDKQAKSRLTSREIELLGLLARGFKYTETAELLDVALSTVQTWVRRIYAKLAVGSRAEAVFEAKQQGIL